MAKVGIYMPAYNVENYIKASINSILDQSFQDWQLIIVDDNSSDHTLQKAMEFSDKRVIVKHRKDHSGHIGKIKNEAIALLDDSEYICHVGSDDLIPNYCLKAFSTVLDSKLEIGAACGSFIAFDNSGKKWELPHVKNDKGFSSERLLRYMCLYPMRFYRRKIVDQVGGYSNELSSAVDYDLALKLDEVTKIVRIEDPPTYYYRQHPTQVSTKSRTEQNENAKKALQNALKRRSVDLDVVNNAPPFILEKQMPKHFIWGR